MRKTNIKLADLFIPRGEYWYSEGINWKAILVLAIAFGIPIIGFIVPPLSSLYDYGWYISVSVSLILYLILNNKTRNK
ncbi:hypothetical protein DDW09_01795 [Sulfolobus sp. SCGC AB-777_L09]|nr:hypothetical protein DDW09_01795 [Sulfolobus sp. SCGC AB-777_L09]